MKKITVLLLLFIAVLITNTLNAQDLMKSSDLSTVKVDYLSDNDLAKISTQLKSNNTNISQVESMALSKGMSQTEFNKLKIKLADFEKKNSNADSKEKGDVKLKTTTKDAEFGRKQEKIKNEKLKDSVNALIFGSELFDNPTLDFAPDLKLATPINYILGPVMNYKLVFMVFRSIMQVFL